MIVGTAGHIDHGKTALVRALTGVDADRLPEEKARGITLDLGFAYWPRPDGQIIGFIDVPGHEKLVHNMLAGATGIDLVLLVVAADDGIMPQTREHLAILDLLGLSRGLVALTKADLADEARRREVTAEIDGDAGRHLSERGRSHSGVCHDRRGHRRAWRAIGRPVPRDRDARGRWPLPTCGRSLLYAGRHRNGRDGDGPVRSRVDRRRGDDQPVRPRGARAVAACAEPRRGARPGRRALCLGPDRRRHHQGGDRPRRHRARSVAPCADQSHRRTAQGPQVRDQAGRANGCRCAFIMLRPT